jgi:hypothetical protein
VPSLQDSLGLLHTWGAGAGFERNQEVQRFERAGDAGGRAIVQHDIRCGGSAQFALLMRAERDGLITISVRLRNSIF